MIAFDLAAIGLGLILGSFIYTVALRLQSGTSLWVRSQCDHCSGIVGWVGLIPVAGYILLRGKCSRCGGSISPVYPIVEVINAGLVWLIFSKTGAALAFFHMVLIFELFFLIALIDFRSYLIYPHPIVAGLVVQCSWLLFFGRTEMRDALFGLFIGAGIFHWVSYSYHLLRKKEGLGAGDATLLGLVGFVFGWQSLFSIIFWASVLGIIGGSIILLGNRQSLKKEIAFGPWLVLSAFLVWRFSDFFHNFPIRIADINRLVL